MKLLLTIAALLISTNAFAYDVYVHGYTRGDGTYVNSYHRSSPDGSIYNNYGYKGN